MRESEPKENKHNLCARICISDPISDDDSRIQIIRHLPTPLFTRESKHIQRRKKTGENRKKGKRIIRMRIFRMLNPCQIKATRRRHAAQLTSDEWRVRCMCGCVHTADHHFVNNTKHAQIQQIRRRIRFHLFSVTMTIASLRYCAVIKLCAEFC